MGLNFKPRGLIAPERYAEIKDMLTHGKTMWEAENDVTYTLEDDENKVFIKKSFEYVAKKEEIYLKITYRKDGNVNLLFGIVKSQTRMSAEEAMEKIMGVLEEGVPMQKAEILEKSGVSNGSWAARIKTLTETGQVRKIGEDGYVPAE